jgi:hypothetical protein
VLHSDIKGLDYYLGDMHILTPHIKEDMEFQREINVKLNSGKSCLKTELISPVWTLETNTL